MPVLVIVFFGMFTLIMFSIILQAIFGDSEEARSMRDSECHTLGWIWLAIFASGVWWGIASITSEYKPTDIEVNQYTGAFERQDNVYIWIDKHCKDITTETPRKAKMEDITVTITKSSGWKYWLHDKSTELKVTVKGKE